MPINLDRASLHLPAPGRLHDRLAAQERLRKPREASLRFWVFARSATRLARCLTAIGAIGAGWMRSCKWLILPRSWRLKG